MLSLSKHGVGFFSNLLKAVQQAARRYKAQRTVCEEAIDGTLVPLVLFGRFGTEGTNVPSASRAVLHLLRPW